MFCLTKSVQTRRDIYKNWECSFLSCQARKSKRTLVDVDLFFILKSWGCLCICMWWRSVYEYFVFHVGADWWSYVIWMMDWWIILCPMPKEELCWNIHIHGWEFFLLLAANSVWSGGACHIIFKKISFLIFIPDFCWIHRIRIILLFCSRGY